MSDRTITVHTFCSVKGGVGKSTLAVVCARLLAAKGRVPVLLDCDLTGTSLADGLELRAPRLPPLADGTVDLAAGPTGEHYGLAETRTLRRRRRDTGDDDRADPPIYLNDLLGQPGRRERAVRADAALWRADDPADGVGYLPSSSIARDLVKSAEWFSSPVLFDWAWRFLWTLDSLAVHKADLTDLVIDLPPGTWGFPHQTMVFVSAIHAAQPLPHGYPSWHEGPIRWRTNPFLVTSSDGNDLVPSLEYASRNRDKLPNLQLLANRFTEGNSKVLERVRARLGPTVGATGLDELFKTVPVLPELEDLFKAGRLTLSAKVRKLEDVLRLGEAR